MTDQPDRSITIRLSLQQAEQAELLEGLDTWLKLGLLSDGQVRQLGQQHLSCPLPTSIAIPTLAPASEARSALAAARTNGFADEFADATDFAPPAPAAVPVGSSQAAPTWWGRSLSAFMAEISVIWLLFLGVFLVVVSSGVLAASQWQNFPPAGQYGILFAYTLAFFAAGLWTGQRPNLRLTARMLQITTLLIIPVNFWMMDGLRLWQSSLGVIVGTIAALTLTALTVFLLRPQSELLHTDRPRLTALNHIGLSWLHWGWSLAGIPLMATYGGAIGTTVLLVWQETRAEGRGQRAEGRGQEAGVVEQTSSVLSPATLVIALSLLLLIGRAVLVAEVSLRQLGLALGLCGWLWCWLTRPSTLQANADRRSIWTPVGVVLLLLGWAVSLAAEPPWQAVIISGLALWLLVDRLRLTAQSKVQSEVLLAAFFVGLQAYGLLWRLCPPDFRQSLIDLAAQIVGHTALPQALIGLAGFPYLWLTLGVAGWLRRDRRQRAEGRRQRAEGRGQTVDSSLLSPQSSVLSPPSSVLFPPSLVRQTETIALILGICLTLISLGNPGVRSLNLLLAAGTLGWVVGKRATASPGLIYLTHITAVIAIVSGIDWRLPALSPMQWAGTFLGMMAIEWGLSLGTNALHWRRSAWYIGLALAGFSYAILLPIARTEQMLIWLITPALLTGLSRLRPFPQVRLAAWLSLGALCAQLLLLSTLNTWIVAFAVATALMLANTYTLRQLFPAVLTIGFGLGLETTLIWREWAEQITDDTILLVLAALLWQLWLLRHRLSRPQPLLPQLYAGAANGWGIVLCGFTLLLLTGLSAAAFAAEAISSPQMLGVGLVMGAIGYRLWQQPTNLGFWGLAWAVETGAAILIGRSAGDAVDLGIANIGLGLVCQLAGTAWVRRSQRPYRSSWHLIPIVYAAFGLLLIHSRFTAFTGLYTLVAALVGIGIGRRHVRFKPLTLLAVLLGSLAAYELLIYQLLQAEGNYPGDGITLLAGLSILIAWSDRLLWHWLLPALHLNASELQAIAHLHWLLGSGLALLAVLDRLSPIGTVLLIVTALALSGYALVMGNQKWNGGDEQRAEGDSLHPSSFIPHPSSFHDAWIYAGIAELLATIGYGLYEAIPDTSFLLSWAGAVAAVLAVGLYTPAWKDWGWSERPWRNAAAGLPAIVVMLTAGHVALQSLLVAAAFYAWLGKARDQIRLSYLSVVLFDWALLRYVQQQGWLNLLWVSTVLCGSLLYVTQVDPGLRSASAREQRHWLRSLSTGLVCLTALYQAEVETGGTAIVVGLLTLGFSIGLIFAGLVLRVRAFLYVGTAAFILRILRWLWLFINTYSLLLWAVGIVLGLIFIWIAATFEARRSQVNAVVQYWSNQLEQWE